ncbi:MAG: class I SAM-dependent methyltransferase [Halanaerobiales bacterium]
MNEKTLTHNNKFNKGAKDFETWFNNNEILFKSELKALKKMLRDPENCLSVGIGNGLFANKLGIKQGIEPSEGMANLAREKGIKVIEGRAEDLPVADNSYKQVLLGTILAYVDNKEKAVREAYRVLKKGGEAIISILPAEGSYAILYKLAESKGYYDLEITPEYPYPLEFVEGTNWITTEKLIAMMKETGFKDLEFIQTLTRHPRYSNKEVEEAIPGYKKGDYVVVKGVK